MIIPGTLSYYITLNCSLQYFFAVYSHIQLFYLRLIKLCKLYRINRPLFSRSSTLLNGQVRVLQAKDQAGVVYIINFSGSNALHKLLDKQARSDYNIKAVQTRETFRGVAQMVARLVRDQEARGSNPRTPTKNTGPPFGGPVFLMCGDLNHPRSRRGRLHVPVLRLVHTYIPSPKGTGCKQIPRTADVLHQSHLGLLFCILRAVKTSGSFFTDRRFSLYLSTYWSSCQKSVPLTPLALAR